MVETMMETQKCLVQQNQEVQDKCNQMMVMFQASQKQNSTQHVEEVEGREAPKQQSATQKHAAATPGFEAEIGPLKSLEPEVDKPKTKRKERKVNKPETKHPEVICMTLPVVFQSNIEVQPNKYTLYFEGTQARARESG